MYGLESSYRFLQLLGKGAEGEVWLAEDIRRAPLRVAVKLIAGAGSGLPEEVRRLAALEHPVLAPVLDAGVVAEEDVAFLVTPHYAGEAVTLFVADAKEDTALDLLNQACLAIAHLNSRGLRHGDLKPGHLLVLPGDPPRLRIIDLGSGVELDDPQPPQVGTPPYAAPEIWDRGGASPGKNADLYALAMVFAEGLIGSLPIRGDNEAWRRWHRQGDREGWFSSAPKALDPALEAILRSCLEVDPDNRPRDAASLSEQLPARRESVDREALPQPLIGRSGILDSLARPRPPGSVDLLTGPPGSGRTRLLQTLKARLLAAGSAAILAPASELDDPAAAARWLQGLPANAEERVLLIDDLDGGRAEAMALTWQWLRERVPRGARLVATGEAASLSGAVSELLQRSGARPQRRSIPPLSERQAIDVLRLEDPSISIDSARQRWQESGGWPGILLGESPAPRPLPDALAGLLAAFPCPIPAGPVAAALGWDLSRLAAHIGDPDIAAPAGAEVPVPPRKSRHLADSGLLAALVRGWLASGDEEASWGSLVLSARARLEPDLEEVRRLRKEARKAGRWDRVLALSEGSVDPGVASAWESREALLTLGRGALLDRPVPAPEGVVDLGFDGVSAAAMVLENEGRGLESRRLWETWLATAPPEGVLKAHAEAARLAIAQGEGEGARKHLQQAIDVLDGGVEAEPEDLLRIAGVVVRSWDLNRAERLFEAALAGARGRGGLSVDVTVGALSGLAGIDRHRGDLESAEERLLLADRYRRLAGIEARHPKILWNLATVQTLRRKIDEAEPRFRELLAELDLAADRRLVPWGRLGLGQVLRDRGALAPALLQLERAAREAEENDDKALLAAVLGNNGDLRLFLGDPLGALAVRQKMHQVALEVGEPALERQSRIALAAARLEAGDIDGAVAVVGEAGSAGEPRLDAWEALLRAQIADAAPASCRQRLDLAARACRLAIRSARPHTLPRALILLARAVAAGGDEGRSRRILERALTEASGEPAPDLARIPVALELALLDHATGGGPDCIKELKRIAREAARLRLFPEHWVAATWILEIDPQEEDLRPRRFARVLRRRYGEAGLETLCRRYQLSGRLLANLSGKGEWMTLSGSYIHGDPDPRRALLDAIARMRVCWPAKSIALLQHRQQGWRRLARVTEEGAEIEKRPAVHPLDIDEEAAAAPVHRRAEAILPLVGALPGDGRWALHVTGFETAPDGADLAPLERAVAGWFDRLQVEILEGKLKALRSQMKELGEERLGERQMLETQLLTQRLELATTSVEGDVPWIAASPALEAIEKGVEAWARSELPILVYGESGTGKTAFLQRFARVVGADPVVVESCAALPEGLLEAELFGFREGAFTGAERPHPGLFERADGGLLILDHIDELPADLQGKFLRVLDAGKFRPLGASEDLEVNFRLATTVRRNPQELIDAELLRVDLYYRMQGIEISLPPLRERREDIRPLLEAHLDCQARQLAVPVPEITPAALELLERDRWTGNVREVVNRVQRWLIAGLRVITPADVRADGNTDEEAREAVWGGGSWRQETERFHKQVVAEALAHHGGNQSHAARALGLSRRHLQTLLTRYNLRSTE